VPAPWSDAQPVLALAHPRPRAPLTAGSRSHVLPAPAGGVKPRWGLMASDHRQTPAPPTVATHCLRRSAQAGQACTKLCRGPCVGAAAARQALATCARGLPAPCRPAVAVDPKRRAGQRGRPRPETPPAHVGDRIAGALASSLVRRQALVAQPTGCMRATHARDATTLSPQEVRDRSTGQAQAARGVRVLQAPQLVAASLSRKQPARILALVLVLTLCWLVSAAFAYRLRHTLQAPEAPVPDHKGTRMPHPTARGVLQSCGGMQVRLTPEPWPVVLHLTAAHQQLLALRGKPYTALDA
jgi:hypothetical protein